MMKNKLAHDVSLCCLLFRNPLCQTVFPGACVWQPFCLWFICSPIRFLLHLPVLRLVKLMRQMILLDQPSSSLFLGFFRLAFLSLCSVAKGVCFCCCFGTHRTDGCDGLRAICCCCSCVFQFPSSLARGVKRVLQTKWGFSYHRRRRRGCWKPVLVELT